jgi:hypothetical protein
MTWVLVGVAAWIVLAVLGALLLCRAIHLADVASSGEPDAVVDDERPDADPGRPAECLPAGERPRRRGRTRLPRSRF